MHGKRTSTDRAALYGTLATLGWALAAGTAHADSGNVRFYQPSEPRVFPDRLEIASEDGHYTGAVDGVGTVDTYVELRLDAGNVGRVVDWEVGMKSAAADVGGVWATEMKLPDRLAESYPIGSRPKQLGRDLHLPVAFSARGTAYCNAFADRLRSQGLTDGEIFAEDRSIEVRLVPTLVYEMSGPSDIWDHAPVLSPPELALFELRCMASESAPPAPPAPSDEEPQRTPQTPLASIAYANLALIQPDGPALCPTDVTAQALFTSDTEGRFVVRLRDAFGHASRAVELEMGAEDFNGSVYVETFEHTFEVGATPEGSDLGSDSGSGGGGFLVQQPESIGYHPLTDEGVLHEVPDWGGVDDVRDPSHTPGEYKNSVWVEIVKAGAGSVSESDHEPYHVVCQGPQPPVLYVPTGPGTVTLDDGGPGGQGTPGGVYRTN